MRKESAERCSRWRRDLENIRWAKGDAFETTLEQAAATAAEYLSQDERSSLEALRLGHVDKVELDDIPIDVPMVGPPLDGARPVEKASFVSELALLGVARFAGEPFGYDQEKKGAIVHQVAKESGKENSNSNGSATFFGAHVDNPAILPPGRPDIIALLGLVNDAKTRTFLIHVEQLVALLPSWTVRTMLEPRFVLQSSDSFEFGGIRVLTEPRPILFADAAGRRRVAFAIYNLTGVDPLAKRAITALRRVLVEENMEATAIGPGKLLLFDNTRHLHARDRVEGARWLQRVYLSRDIQALQQLAGGRRAFDLRRLLIPGYASAA